MEKKLRLQVNRKDVNMYARKIEKLVVQEVIEKGFFDKNFFADYCVFEDELIKRGIPLAEYISVNKVIAMNYGWLLNKTLVDSEYCPACSNYGEELEKILIEKSNLQN